MSPLPNGFVGWRSPVLNSSALGARAPRTAPPPTGAPPASPARRRNWERVSPSSDSIAAAAVSRTAPSTSTSANPSLSLITAPWALGGF